MSSILIDFKICRAIRGYLGLSQKDFALASGLSIQTIVDFERGARVPHRNNQKSIVEFIKTQNINLIYENEIVVGLMATEVKNT